MNTYFVYILASLSGVLYVGTTNNLERRLYEHKNHLVPGFTDKYNVTRLVYFEETVNHMAAIAREKQIKNWRREKKENLIESFNPGWADLAENWFGDE